MVHVSTEHCTGMLRFFGFLAGARFVDDGAFCLLETGGRCLVDARTPFPLLLLDLAVMDAGEVLYS